MINGEEALHLDEIYMPLDSRRPWTEHLYRGNLRCSGCSLVNRFCCSISLHEKSLFALVVKDIIETQKLLACDGILLRQISPLQMAMNTKQLLAAQDVDEHKIGAGKSW